MVILGITSSLIGLGGVLIDYVYNIWINPEVTPRGQWIALITDKGLVFSNTPSTERVNNSSPGIENNGIIVRNMPHG